MRIDTLLLDPFTEMIHQVLGFIPTLLTSLGILIIGWIFARIVRKILDRVFKAIHFDKLSTEVGLSRVLRIGGVKHKPGDMVSCMVYAVLMVITLITSVKTFGHHVVIDALDKTLAYIPSVIAGAIVLVIGMLLAKFISGIVYVTAKNTDMPIPETLAKLTKWAIVAYVSVIYLKGIGFLTLFTGTGYTIFIGGLVFAVALAFGLAGKDVAAKYLTVFKHE